MEHNRNRKLNSTISPLRDHNLNQGYSKMTDTAAESENLLHPKQFSESPLSTECAVRKKRGEQAWNCSLSEINYELDSNMNEIIYLLGRRKNLILAKKKKIRQKCEDEIEKTRSNKTNINQSDFQYENDSQFKKIVDFCDDSSKAVSMFQKMVKILPEMHGSKNDEESRSQIFWSRNKKLENQIDVVLEKLKNIDKNLQRENHQVHSICKQLDHIQENLKSFVGAKSNEHVKQVQSLFSTKKQKYNTLNWKVKGREVSRDQKIKLIQNIKAVLQELKNTREIRLNQIAKFFGVSNLREFQNIDFNNGFTSSFEEILKIKEKVQTFDSYEKQALRDIEILQREQQKLYTELLKRQSDQAKAFHNYENIMSKKIKYNSILNLLLTDEQHCSVLSMNGPDLGKKFKDYKTLIARFMQQDNLLKQGLLKTSETTKTFTNLLKATKNEKQRRQELLNLLQACIHRRGEYEQKKEQVRNIVVQEAKNKQELSQYEQELELVLTDGGIEEYKNLGNAIRKCQNQGKKLNNLRDIIEKQMEAMDRQALGLISQVQQQYEDILCDIIPSDLEYSLKNGQDVKRLRNHLRKMYKRLGILKSQ